MALEAGGIHLVDLPPGATGVARITSEAPSTSASGPRVRDARVGRTGRPPRGPARRPAPPAVAAVVEELLHLFVEEGLAIAGELDGSTGLHLFDDFLERGKVQFPFRPPVDIQSRHAKAAFLVAIVGQFDVDCAQRHAEIKGG